jgi:hypothetical protein
MNDAALPKGWVNKDIRDVIPEQAIPIVLRFCQNVLREAKVAGFNGDNIAQRAKALLEPHSLVFNAVGTDVGYFSYWLLNAWNQGQFEQIVATLQQPKPKALSLDEVLPPEGIETLREFLDNCKRGTLIIEPRKAYVTLLRERVLDPYKDYILNKSGSGITDLDYLALTICMAANIPPQEVPS